MELTTKDKLLLSRAIDFVLDSAEVSSLQEILGDDLLEEEDTNALIFLKEQFDKK